MGRRSRAGRGSFAPGRGLLTALVLILGMVPPAAAQDYSLTIAATTSVEDSGLFALLLPKFESRTGMKVRVLSRPSSGALSMAARGGVDVVIVNHPDGLARFVNAGEAVRRRDLMYNDFVIVGPASDPAKVTGSKDAPEALRTIARLRAPFFSRGDESGTHVAEQRLWTVAGVEPKTRSGDWYRQTGLGMGATVEMASRSGGYVLTDRASWLAHQSGNDQRILFEGDPRLFDQYQVAAVNPEKHPEMSLAAALAFVEWLISVEGQDAIAGYKIDGQQAFFPNAKVQN
jgi:tungstate transport system substrate-binding protein